MSTKTAPRHGTAPALAVSGWPLRRKVALALAIPLLVAATLGGLRVRDELQEATNSSTSARQVAVLGPAVEYLVAAERAMVAAHTESPADLETAVRDLKAAAGDLAAVRNSADLNSDQRYQADLVLDLSRALRESSAESLSLGTWVAQLRQLQSGVTQLITTIVNAQLNPEPRLELLAQTLGGRFSLAMQQALVATDRTGETASLELFAELGAEGAAIDRLASALGHEPSTATLRTENAERFRTVRTKGTDLGGTDAYAAYDVLVDDLLVAIDEQLTASAGDARARALAAAVATVAALVAAILLALLISRLILIPIRRVREGALSVAHEQLPEAIARLRAGEDPGRITPVDVSTEEEIGQLARAVDDLHRQAVLLASGEAQLRSQVSDMFVTLSRRNTTLVNQQLALIETLEKDEEDPRRLESLFRLDHLASRMRRTGDSLMILAGAPSRGGGGGEEGLTVADAMQAATAGVQDYQRVRIDTTSDLRVSDAASGDVVHMLTELVDNSLTYSAPTTYVTLSAKSTPGGVQIEIADNGLGIPGDSLIELNEMLRSGGDVTPDTARRMGVFVVSRLAKQHGVAVGLRRNEQNGTTASVLLPKSILSTMQGPQAEGPTAALARQPKPEVTPDEPRRPKPEMTPDEPRGPLDLQSIEHRISSAMGRRQPSSQPEVVVSAAEPKVVERAPEPKVVERAPEPKVVERAPEPKVVERAPEPKVVERAPEPKVVERAPEPKVVERAPEPKVVERAPEPKVVVPAPEPKVVVPAPEPKVVVPAPEPKVVVPAPVGLEVVRSKPVDDDADTPIFRAMRSAWLSTGEATPAWASTEVEEGWEQADRVAATAPAVNAVGLPQRRPGTRLVPGGVTKPTAAVTRNPEAIRARLAAHAAGVSRGRAAATPTDGHEHTEAGQA